MRALGLGRRRARSVLVVGEDPLARKGLASALAAEADLEIVGQAAGGDDVAAAARSLGADALVLDLGMDAVLGVARLRALEGIEAPVLVLLGDPSRADEAFALGARGLLFRDGDVARLARAIVAVARGMVVLEDAIATALVRAPTAGLTPTETLTRREIEVLEHLAQGSSNKAIAETLGISEHTVKFHVNAILNKLGAESRTEAVVLAARLGLVAL